MVLAFAIKSITREFSASVVFQVQEGASVTVLLLDAALDNHHVDNAQHCRSEVVVVDAGSNVADHQHVGVSGVAAVTGLALMTLLEALLRVHKLLGLRHDRVLHELLLLWLLLRHGVGIDQH